TIKAHSDPVYKDLQSGCPNVIKINTIEHARKPTAKYAELYRNITQSSNVRSNNFGPPIIEDWDSEDESDTESTPIESIREFEALMHGKFKMSAMGELSFFLGLQVLQKKDCIFLSQDKYVGDILKKFGFSDLMSANTPMDRENPWGKDGTGKDVDLHLYLKGHPKLGLWYPKKSPFDLVAYSDSDYGGASQDRKSTTEGCQFLGRGLISWQCKKQTIVATSTTKAEYVIAASRCGQVLWIQNQLIDYG
ncbi:putative ribonuclease H-like domain-containing protein, partial [Tanacetum coccineum]